MKIGDDIRRVAKQIVSGGRNVVFTGAGISTESGIPDYRSQGWLWDRFRPVYFDEFMNSRDARVEYWRRKMAMYDGLMAAKPNAAHLALTEFHDMGLMDAVITQNIDGLHQRSGLPESKIVELHGNTLRVRCMTCDALSTFPEARERILQGDAAPECACGGYLKPDTISFGQTMPQEEVEKASRLSAGCSFFMVIGSTLLVQPAAGMPQLAKSHGAFLTIVNLSETPQDGAADVLIRGKAGEILDRIVEAVKVMAS